MAGYEELGLPHIILEFSSNLGDDVVPLLALGRYFCALGWTSL